MNLSRPLTQRIFSSVILVLFLSLAWLSGTFSAGALPVFLDGPVNIQSIVYELRPGFSAIANPFWHKRGTIVRDSHIDNSVSALFPRMPAGTIFYKLEPKKKRYTTNHYGKYGWSKPAETLDPGEGALIFNPISRPLKISVSGDQSNWGMSVEIPAGFSLISFPGIVFEPRTLAPGEFAMDWWDSRFFHPQEEDLVFTLDRLRGTLVRHSFRNGKWDAPPSVSWSEAFFVFTRVPRRIVNKDPAPT
jgi:hypothetical protein